MLVAPAGDISETAGVPAVSAWPPAHTEPPTVACAFVATCPFAAIDAAVPGPPSSVEYVWSTPETASESQAQAANRKRRATSPLH